MFFGAILSSEVDEPKHKGNKSLFKVYRVIFITEVLPTVGKLSHSNFGAWPQIFLGKKNGMLREYQGIVASSTRGNDAENGSILLGGTVYVISLESFVKRSFIFRGSFELPPLAAA